MQMSKAERNLRKIGIYKSKNLLNQNHHHRKKNVNSLYAAFTTTKKLPLSTNKLDISITKLP